MMRSTSIIVLALLFAYTGALPQDRIINGNDAAVGQIPFQVGLTLSDSLENWWCGGSIISTNWVLTAAHCTDGAVYAIVYLGATDRTKPEKVLYVTNSNFIQHEDYQPAPYVMNDISLIKIPTITYTKNIQKVAIPKISTSYSSYAGNIATSSGWGITKENTNVLPTNLQYVHLKIITNSLCNETYHSTLVNKGSLCTATPQATTTCEGDSGGPLVDLASGKLIGINSFVSGDGCEAGDPAGFVRVTAYLNWIRKNSGVVGV
ncbi:serine protease 3-like [Teleopsis dalmanni]|uniref:serine protease 3-like n=1 Tax=Teleopsis dalmanni TaxID=139649 RepID=UPI000D32CCC0|nr:serine protease 3-like [Teleopsis dalmanni]